MPIGGLIDTENLYMYSGIVALGRKRENPIICDNMDKLEDIY